MSAADLQREVFASFARGDLDAIFTLYDESCVIREAPSLPWGGEFVGHEGLRELLARMTTNFDISSRVVEILGSSDTAIVALIEMELRSKRTGRRLDMKVAEVTRSRDGRIVEQMPFYWDTQLINNES
jgi:ketosteroid isomerase-like protein